MMAWVEANGGVRAIGDAGHAQIATADWNERPGGPTIPRPVDETISGAVSALSVPVGRATLTDATGRRRYDLDGDRQLEHGDYLLECRLAVDREPGSSRSGSATEYRGTGIETYLRFAGPAAVGVSEGTISLTFGSVTPVALGFTERYDDPATITVRPTPEGAATALTHLSASLQTTGPERSHPSMRDHPPIVETGGTESIPEAVRTGTPETGIELRLPSSFEYLFVGAPLAYYLGAEVTVSDREEPVLLAPETGVRYRFRELPTFQHGVARLLRQVFFFDTLVRDLDGETAQKRRLCEELHLDPSVVRTLSPAERLARYFWVAEDDLDGHLPEWHFSTYAAPEARNVGCLPYLLDALSLIYLPEASELRGTELLERTLDDYYRGQRASKATVASVDMLKPERRAGRVHAWLAPGAPIDAFKTTPQAYENRRRYNDRGTPLSVTVVLNDAEMSDEHTTVADIYRERSADLPLSVDVREYLTTGELADVFAARNDFVHYIGHCDVNGLECVDGTLSTSELDDCRTRTFFLNACGSYHEGLSLIERGSVAGAVTLTRVLDRQAAKVGSAFARLLVNGFGLEPAMQLSRRRVMMGKDYAVVGDGTYTLAPSAGSPTVGWLSETDDGYYLRCEETSARRNGDTFQPPFETEATLHGTSAGTTLSRAELLDVLAGASLPVIYENEFYWSGDLADRLATDRRSSR